MMGFFSKLKDNFKKGGVKVKLESPGSFSHADQSIQLSVTVTNGEQPRVVNGVRITLEKEVSTQGAGSSSSSSTRREDVTSYVVPDSVCTLQPGETKTFAVTFPVSAQGLTQAAGVTDETAQAVAGVLNKISQVANALSNVDARYSIIAVADVDGITLDPSDRNYISFNTPGHIGTTLNV